MIPFLTAFRRALPLLAAALFSCGREVDPADPLPSVVTVPQNVYLHGSTEHSLTFQWDPVDGAIGFNWKLTRDGAAVSDGSVTSRNVTVSSLDPGTTYAFSVCAVGTSNVSAYSAVVEATTQGNPPVVIPFPQKICVDEPLVLPMDKKPVLGSSGLIRVFTTDGTEVGIYGGVMPYSSVPFYMVRKRTTVSNRSNSDGTLNVEIEILNEEEGE